MLRGLSPSAGRTMAFQPELCAPVEGLSGYSRLFFEEASGLMCSERSSPRLLGVPLYFQSRLVVRGFDDLWVTPDFCRDGLGLLGQLCSGQACEA